MSTLSQDDRARKVFLEDVGRQVADCAEYAFVAEELANKVNNLAESAGQFSDKLGDHRVILSSRCEPAL